MSDATYLLDTDTCSHFLRGHAGLDRKFDSVRADNLYISRVTVAELTTAALHKPTRAISEESVAAFVHRFNVIAIDEPHWDLFPRVKADLLKRGLPLGDTGNLDILLAVTAVVGDHVVVTHNRKHFVAIQSVLPFSIEDWVDEVDQSCATS